MNKQARSRTQVLRMSLARSSPQTRWLRQLRLNSPRLRSLREMIQLPGDQAFAPLDMKFAEFMKSEPSQQAQNEFIAASKACEKLEAKKLELVATRNFREKRELIAEIKRLSNSISPGSKRAAIKRKVALTRLIRICMQTYGKEELENFFKVGKSPNYTRWIEWLGREGFSLYDDKRPLEKKDEHARTNRMVRLEIKRLTGIEGKRGRPAGTTGVKWAKTCSSKPGNKSPSPK
jgi:hypothetical protein